MGDEYIVENSIRVSKIPSVVGALLAVILLIVIVALVIWYYKFGGKKYLPNFKRKSNQNSSGSNPRSFENPYFNQEVTMSNLQANDVSGNTMAEAISTNETVANDDITMDDTETSNENQSSSP